MLTFDIVGSFYRPPAQLIINALPSGTKLYARAEPTNEVDPNAICVLVLTTDIPTECHDDLQNEVSKRGLELSQILSQSEWHLGYIRKEIAAELKQHNFITDLDLVGKLKINFAGKPQIEIEE